MLLLPEQAGRISLVACDTHTDTHMLVEKQTKTVLINVTADISSHNKSLAQ